MKSVLKLATLAFLASAIPATAEPISEGVWQLQNNETHRLGSAGFYRYNGAGYDLYDFETNGAEVLMTYDGDAGTISVGGQAYDPTSDRLVSFDLDYANVTLDGDRVVIGESTAVGVFDGVEVMSKGMNGQTFYLDSDGLNTSLTGHGWLGTDAGHFGDFHLNGTRIAELGGATDPAQAGTNPGGGSVPAPGGLALLLVGGLGLVLLGRSRRSKG